MTWSVGRNRLCGGMTLPLLLLTSACGGSLKTIQVEQSATTVVPGGSLLEDLLGSLGFDAFTSMDITESEELENQGVEPGDVVDVELVAFELEALEPSGSDLAFLDSMQVLALAEGLPEIQVASQTSFPEGQALVEFQLSGEDLTDYVTSQAMTLTTQVTGHSPSEDTTVEARFVLDVGVTLQGAANQL